VYALRERNAKVAQLHATVPAFLLLEKYAYPAPSLRLPIFFFAAFDVGKLWNW
jgi:hypothetical protein